MVDASYMTENAGPPSAAKRYFDQEVIPAAIDALGGLEAGVEQVARAVKARPALVLAGALLLGAALPALILAMQARRGPWYRR